MTRAIVVCGERDSGKTTWVCSLVESLSRRGLRVGTIKHTHHDCRPPRKDSTRHQNAGASRVLLVSPTGVIRYDEPTVEPTLETLIETEFANFDLVLIEGYRRSDLPKLIVGQDPNANEAQLILRLGVVDGPPDDAAVALATAAVVNYLAATSSSDPGPGQSRTTRT